MAEGETPPQEPKPTGGLAAMDPRTYGVIPTETALAKRDRQKLSDISSKVKELLSSVHEIAFSKGNIDDQSRLSWENIEGEVIGTVLAFSIGSGTPFTQIHDHFFNFASVDTCVEDMVGKQLAESIRKRQDIIPSFAALKENLNRLIISLEGKGREELIKMLQAFSVSLQEQERSDPSKSLLRRL